MTNLAQYNDDGDKVSECSGTGEWGVYPARQGSEAVVYQCL
ncbi:hypothetical protein ACFWJU_33125 [Streptomyces mutabilis]